MSSETGASEPLDVVVVDDTPDLRDLLAMALERRGEFRVVAQGTNGREGIELARSHQPDVVLLDIAMPVMDGLEALPLIREACPHATLVMLSGFGASEMTDRALASGADGYIRKGQSISALLEQVRGYAEHNAALRGTRMPPPPRERTRRADGLAVRAAAEDSDAESEADNLRRSIATAAHEIRNPVSILGAAAEALLDEEVTDGVEQDRMLSMIVRQAHLLDAITADLLTAGQAQHGTLVLKSEPHAPMGLVRAITGDLPDVAVVDTSTRHVMTDPTRFQQMLGNLLANARKYAAPPFVVRVSSRDGLIQVDVEDEGDGVPEEFRPKLFQEYARAEGNGASGTGLGLYVVRMLAEAQGGTVGYQPREPRGSVFTITLPAAPD